MRLAACGAEMYPMGGLAMKRHVFRGWKKLPLVGWVGAGGLVVGGFTFHRV